MPITPTNAPASSYPQNTTPSSISFCNFSLDMYGSVQQSAGIIPLYACAPSLMMVQISSKSRSSQRRIIGIQPPDTAQKSSEIFPTCGQFHSTFDQSSHSLSID